MRGYGIVTIALSLGAAMLAACVETPYEVIDGAGEYAELSRPIYYGSSADRPEHAAVVSLHQRSGNYVYASPFCSGTLIAADVVLTAAHCLDVGKGKKARAMPPDALVVYVGDRPADDLLSHVYAVADTVLHPDFHRVKLLDDVALLRVASPVTESLPVSCLPASLGFTSADIGQTLNFAGFGTTEHGTSGMKLQVNLPLAALGCGVYGCPNSGDSATQLSYSQADYQGGPCSGDSGGPAFFERGGTPYVAGVTSYGDYACREYGVSTRVDAFASWIDAYVDGSQELDCSADGVCNEACEVDPDCGANEGCGDGVCDATESCDGRSGTTACSADCPGKTTGKPSGRYCLIGGVCEGPGCP